jgi:prevent-host-death family protein
MTMVKYMRQVQQQIPAGQFKANCLSLMDEVNQQQRVIVITKHGKPIAKLVPFVETRKSLFGAMKGTVKIMGDIVQPTGESWEADED